MQDEQTPTTPPQAVPSVTSPPETLNEPVVVDAEGPSNSPEGKGPWATFKSIASTLGIFLIAPLVAILLTAFVFQSYEVDGQSMERTLQDRDRLIVYKLPKTWSRIRRQHYQPQRGDIVVFAKEGIFSAGSERQLIKRVIGLPGDHVIVKDGKITIFNEDHPTGFNPDEDQPYSDNLPATTEGNIDITVEDGHVFVVGDNRSNSQDSRIFGPISTDTISGTLLLRIFPFSGFQSY